MSQISYVPALDAAERNLIACGPSNVSPSHMVLQDTLLYS